MATISASRLTTKALARCIWVRLFNAYVGIGDQFRVKGYCTFGEPLRQREQMKIEIRQHYELHGVEVLMFPPILCPPPPLGDNFEIEIRGEKIPIRTAIGRNTALAACGSLCGLVLPAGLTTLGLPVGVEFDALPNKDRALLSLGLALEKALGPIAEPNL